MARGKKGKKQKADDVALHGTAEAVFSAKRQEKQVERRFRWWDYIVIGIFFVAFCEFQIFVASRLIGAQDDVTKSNVEYDALSFLYGTMWKCFLIVLVLVWLYDYFYRETEQDTA